MISVPKGTGLRYALISKDYSLHHLSEIIAKLLGFRTAIVHGMWTLGRVFSELEKVANPNSAFKLEALFKRPIFMPATTSLRYKILFLKKQNIIQNNISPKLRDEEDAKKNIFVNFELLDQRSLLPHLTGSLQFEEKIS